MLRVRSTFFDKKFFNTCKRGQYLITKIVIIALDTFHMKDLSKHTLHFVFHLIKILHKQIAHVMFFIHIAG